MLHFNRKRRTRFSLPALLLLLMVTAAGCDNFVVYDEFAASVDAAAQEDLPLALSPANVAVKTTEGVAFAASGGTPDYVFAVASGGGTIDAQTGYYTAPATAGGPLGITPTNPVLAESATTNFSGYGGTPGYSFSIASGPGTILATLGSYTAPDQVGSNLAEVRITDSADPQATVTTLVTVVPATPTNLDADGTFGTTTDILLTWEDNSSSEDGYRIEGKPNDGSFSEIATVPADSTSFLDTNRLPNQLYIYRISAFTTGADPLQSGYSNEAYDFSN